MNRLLQRWTRQATLTALLCMLGSFQLYSMNPGLLVTFLDKQREQGGTKITSAKPGDCVVLEICIDTTKGAADGIYTVDVLTGNLSPLSTIGTCATKGTIDQVTNVFLWEVTVTKGNAEKMFLFMKVPQDDSLCGGSSVFAFVEFFPPPPGERKDVKSPLDIDAPQPTVTIEGNTDVCAGKPICLCAVPLVEGEPDPDRPYKYVWTKNTEEFAKTQCIKIKCAKKSDEANYAVTITDCNGCTATDNKFVTVCRRRTRP